MSLLEDWKAQVTSVLGWVQVCAVICPDSFPMVALEKMQVFSSSGLNGTDR